MNANDNMNEKLLAYLDGELNADESREVELWLEQNPSAMDEMESLFEVRELLNTYSAPAPPAGLANDIIAKARFAKPHDSTGLFRLTLFAATLIIGLIAWMFALDISKGIDARRKIASIERNKSLSTNYDYQMDDDDIDETRFKSELEKWEEASRNDSLEITSSSTAVVKLNSVQSTSLPSTPQTNIPEGAPSGQGDNPGFQPESPENGISSGNGNPVPTSTGYASHRGGNDKNRQEKVEKDADLPINDAKMHEEKQKDVSENDSESEDRTPAKGMKKQEHELVVKNLGKATLWYTTNDSTLVFKGGSLEIATLKPLAVNIPSFGLIELAANTTLKITLYDYTDGKVVELPGLALKSSAEKCSIQFHLVSGSAVYHRIVGDTVNLDTPGSWVFDYQGRDHEYID